MVDKLVLDNKEFLLKNMSETSKQNLSNLQFADKQIEELSNMFALLQNTKAAYVNNLKREILSKKAGFHIDNN